MLENGKTLPGHKLQSTLWKWHNRKQNPHLIQNRNRKKYPKTHMEPQKTPIAKTAPEQTRQCQRDYNSRLQNILQSHNHKNNMVLAENLRFHLTLVRTAMINWTTHNKCWRRCALLMGLKTGTVTFKITTENSQKLQINLPCDPGIPLPGKCPEAGTPTPQYSLSHAHCYSACPQERGDGKYLNVLQLFNE